jgi:ABC-type phosphate/phosphonate transport system permease subunit
VVIAGTLPRFLHGDIIASMNERTKQMAIFGLLLGVMTGILAFFAMRC